MNAHTPLIQPAGMPAGMNPAEWRRSIETRLNELLDASMALITALDMMEADADLEPEFDDDEHEDKEVGGDDEPSLASPEVHHRQVGWCRGADKDGEVDDSDFEDGADAEPDLAY